MISRDASISISIGGKTCECLQLVAKVALETSVLELWSL